MRMLEQMSEVMAKHGVAMCDRVVMKMVAGSLVIDGAEKLPSSWLLAINESMCICFLTL